MKYSISSNVSGTLPKLAWIAHIPKSPSEVKVIHGTNVEVFASGVVEGCWDGEFNQFGFCETRHLFGSGLFVKNDRVLAAGSASLTDRLVWADNGEYFLCSNSQPLLLAAAGARLDPYQDYARVCSTSLKGVRQYLPDLPTIGAVHKLQSIIRAFSGVQ